MELLSLIEKKFKDDSELRVLTDSASSKRFGLSSNEKATQLRILLKKINLENLKKDKNWKEKWISKAKLTTKPSGVKEWFYGGYSVPFRAILVLEHFSSKEDFSLIKSNCEYFCTKTSSPVKLPEELSPELAWIVAAILCDGHLRKNREGIAFEVGDYLLAKKFGECFSKVFGVQEKPPRTVSRQGRNTTYSVEYHNAPVTLFFNKIFDIPIGRKSAIIRVPRLIFSSSTELKRAFLKGVFDTDGGKRGGGLGLTSMSEKFIKDVIDLLKEFEIKASSESWLNKKYNKKCFGLRFKIDAHSMFLMRLGKAGAKC